MGWATKHGLQSYVMVVHDLDDLGVPPRIGNLQMMFQKFPMKSGKIDHDRDLTVTMVKGKYSTITLIQAGELL